MGISQYEAEKAAEYSAAEGDRKCLAVDTAGEGQK